MSPLLPAAVRNTAEMDKIIAGSSAGKLLDGILDVGALRHPDLDDWTAGVTETAPPPAPISDESFLERDFYISFLGSSSWAPPSWNDPVPTAVSDHHAAGKKPRNGHCARKFHSTSSNRTSYCKRRTPTFRKSPSSYGRAFHASAENSQVADDADKHAALRGAGYLVWAFSHDDL